MLVFSDNIRYEIIKPHAIIHDISPGNKILILGRTYTGKELISIVGGMVKLTQFVKACLFIRNGKVVGLIFCGCAFINANQKSVWLTGGTSPQSWSCFGFPSHFQTFQCRFNGIN